MASLEPWDVDSIPSPAQWVKDTRLPRVGRNYSLDLKSKKKKKEKEKKNRYFLEFLLWCNGIGGILGELQCKFNSLPGTVH